MGVYGAIEGDPDGKFVGARLGVKEGKVLGADDTDGAKDGTLLGGTDGTEEGPDEGSLEGTRDGTAEGNIVGTELIDGAELGASARSEKTVVASNERRKLTSGGPSSLTSTTPTLNAAIATIAATPAVHKRTLLVRTMAPVSVVFRVLISKL